MQSTTAQAASSANPTASSNPQHQSSSTHSHNNSSSNSSVATQGLQQSQPMQLSNSTNPSTSTSSAASSASLPPPPAPWEPRSINVYKAEAMSLIGEGTYGSVWLARAPNGMKVALKKIRKEKKEGFPITAIREIKILKAIKHVNVVSLRDVVSSHMPGKEGDVFMVFEFLDHDLRGIMESKIPLGDALIKYYIRCILEGLQYLHSKAILHRDIKGANILVSNNGDVRIADMGLARSMAKGGYTNRVVTLWYRAPELLLGSCEYDAKIDVWSAGCVFAELLTKGQVLFPGNTTELDQITKIFNICGSPDEQSWPGVSKLKYFNQFAPKPKRRVLREMFSPLVRSPLAIDLLDKLLTLNPAERLSAEQALDHEYFFEEPLAIEPHQHPVFKENLHEFGGKERKKNNNRAAAAGGAGGQQGGAAAASAPGMMGRGDRMVVTSHERFGNGNFALNQPPGYQHGHHAHQQQQQHHAHHHHQGQHVPSAAANTQPQRNAQQGGYQQHRY